MPVRERLLAATIELQGTASDPSAYIPRDPVVSIFLSHIASGRALEDALLAISAASPAHPFPSNRAPRVAIADQARLILVGDWGSGIDQAVKVARHMREHVEDGRRAGCEVHVISLGDVYYSGLAFEYEDYFLPHWPVRINEAPTVYSWALNGNHDMYAGGGAFFEMLLADTRFARQNGSSYFLLENAHWQVAGLDTSYSPPDESGSHANLYGDQATWLRQQRDAAKRTMLLTHHPFFSAFDPTGTELNRALLPVLNQRTIDAWFWGHEHRCAVYRDPAGPVQFASLIGHGGIPMPSTAQVDTKRAPLTYHYQEEFAPGLSYCGFAVLDLDGPATTIRYYNETGACHHIESI
jgi:hypothetical protein